MTEPRLKKKLGQHHLVRPELCAPLLRYLRPEGRTVIEVGPGGGVLTDQLVREARKVLALELDREWAFELGQRQVGGAALAVVDALSVAWQRVESGTLVAGNLPYEIASALIRRLLPLHERVERMSFLVQREVAERFVAQPGSKQYGVLAVLAAAWSEVTLLGTVARGSFRPAPKVEGAFLGLRLKPGPLPAERMAAFVRTVELAFSQRRKTLRNALASAWGRERADRALAQAELDPRCRAEQLELESFVRLAALGSS